MTFFNPKVAKKDYTRAKSFRAISLTTIFFIITSTLTAGEVNNNRPWRYSQRVEKVLSFKDVALNVFLNIGRAFDKM